MAMPESPTLLLTAQERMPVLLAAFLAPRNPLAERLSEAMRYAVMNGGKRVRPALVFGAVQAVGGNVLRAESAAIAVELVHCYSLVHDDLPCMDDDNLRRGVPTCHKVFGEATALLAGDTLQALAFIALGEGRISAEGTADQLRALALAAADMAVGQALDLAGEGQSLDVAALEQIHRHKTGALIRASVALGAIAGGGGEAVRKALDTFADRLGLAFQVHDDVLDVIGDTDRIGKTAGADAALRKSTYPALLGLAEAQALAVRLHDEAVAALASLGPAANPLRELAHFLVSRDH